MEIVIGTTAVVAAVGMKGRERVRGVNVTASVGVLHSSIGVRNAERCSLDCG